MSSKSYSPPRRGSSLSPRRVGKPDTSSTSRMLTQVAKNKFLWSYVLAAIVVYLIILFVVYNEFHNVNAWARLPSWVANPVVHSVLLIVGLVLAALTTAYASTYLDSRWAVIVQALFLVIALLLVIIAVSIYRSHNFLLPFWLSIVALILLIQHTFIVMNAHPGLFIMNVPALVYFALVVYYTWYMADETRALSSV